MGSQLKDFAHQIRSREECISQSVQTSSHDARADDLFHNDPQDSFDWSPVTQQSGVVTLQHLSKVSTSANDKEVGHLSPHASSIGRSNDADIYFQRTKNKIRFGCLDSDSD